jgi:hypothetical protein
VNEQQQKTRLLKAEDIAVMLGLRVQTVYTMARRGHDSHRVPVSCSKMCRMREQKVFGKVDRFLWNLVERAESVTG